MKEREEKAKAVITIGTLRVTYHCVCERKLTNVKRNQRKMKRAAAAEWNVMMAAKRGHKMLKAKTKALLQNNMRSLNSSERFEELTQEVEGCRLDAILICDTWRASDVEIGET